MLFYTHNPSKFAFSREKTDIGVHHIDDHIPQNLINSKIPLKDKSDKIFGLIGVPFDSTTTYKPGARFGPAAVREASYNFENYNMSFNCSLSSIFFDFGDVEVSPGNFKRTCSNLQETVLELLENRISPIVIGGDHSISYGVLKAFKTFSDLDEVTVVHFDAHMDIIDTYIQEKYSHATVMRRIFDLNPKKIIQIGVRSASLEEMDFVNDQKIEYYTASDVRKDIGIIKNVLSKLQGPIYLTVDIDVLDPSYAPSVGTPSPCGISPCHVEDLIKILANKDVIGMDLVEVASDSIGDMTSINGAKIIYDFLCLQE
ncbi:agmatinase [Methanobacterium alcaliphilum]|uniref:agmatinase n=1 Tax=Methanobacterium alcaliphilum TaxID=392018 RepID=UPI00200AC387|nr:agmatinase [Methanobacterium alcaliphilum]MCK9150930.1 agmatinase [Methanobacterium alcaliphilum]